MKHPILKTVSQLTLAAFLMVVAIPNALAEMININKADVVTLSQLKGIGKVKAKAIVAYREENGRFKSIQELTAVKGIGEKIFNKLRDEASVSKGMTKMPKRVTKAKRAAKAGKLKTAS